MNRPKSLAELQTDKQRNSQKSQITLGDDSVSNSRPQSLKVNQNDNTNPNGYENLARQQFFSNRAAAQAVKAKVEQYERGPSTNSNCYSNQQQQSRLSMDSAPNLAVVKNRDDSRRYSMDEEDSETRINTIK